MLDVEKAKGLNYLQAIKAVTERLFLESYLSRLDDQGSEGYPSSQTELKGMDISE